MLKSLASIALVLTAATAQAAPCGNDAAGFDAWKQAFAAEAAAQGVGQAGLQALASASYSTATIRLDRAVQREARPFDEIWRVRGGDQLGQQGRQRYADNRAFFDGLEQTFGIPGYYLVAIHGWETNFGSDLRFVEIPIISAITTVAYDCRRPELFGPHALSALLLVDQGRLAAVIWGPGMARWAILSFCPATPCATASTAMVTGRLI